MRTVAVFAAMAVCILASAAAAEPVGACRAGPPKAPAPGLDGLRPTPTAICDYGLDEVRTRMRRLFHDASSLSVESVETAFAIHR
jgi:hypothetical protein